MSDYLIVVVNRASARFFNLEPVEFPEFESGPRMVTCKELKNPEINDFQEMVTDSKTGRWVCPATSSILACFVDQLYRAMLWLLRRRQSLAGVLEGILVSR